jgi:type III secretory pathway component EscR
LPPPTLLARSQFADLVPVLTILRNTFGKNNIWPNYACHALATLPLDIS